MRQAATGVANTIQAGPFVSAGDGFTVMNSLTIAPSLVFLSKVAGNMALKSDANTAFHRRQGFYPIPLDATDLNTPGNLILSVNHQSCLPFRYEMEVGNIPVIANAASIPGFGFQSIGNSVWNTPSRTVDAVSASIPGFSFQAIPNSVWAFAVENTIQAQEQLRGIAAFAFNKSSGGGTTTGTFRDMADSKNRISATMNTLGNRTAVVLDLT